MILNPRTSTHSLSTDLRQRKTMLTTTEVITLLRLSRNTLCSWCRAGKLPSTRMPDGSYLFDPLTLAAWIEARTS